MKLQRRQMRRIRHVLAWSVFLAVPFLPWSGLSEVRGQDIRVEYYREIEDKGIVESRYRDRGFYEVETAILSRGNEAYGKYTYRVWYPLKMMEKGRTFPAVLLLNGTGNTYRTDEPLYEHLASWGFIVLGNTDKSAGQGKSADYGMEALLAANADPQSIFYEKVQTDHVGIGGYSQGGVGAVNAVSKGRYGDQYKTIVTISAVTKSLVNHLHPHKWHYETKHIEIPYFMVAGTGPVDRKIICPLKEMQDNVAQMADSVPVVLARRSGADHFDVQEQADGYVTAWFRYILGGDGYAARAFVGETAEIDKNPNWENVYRRKL